MSALSIPQVRAPRGATVLWLAAVPVLSVLAGAATASRPLVILGLAGALAATAAFYLWPALLLAAILVVRPFLDGTATLLSFGELGNLSGLLAIALVVGGTTALLLKGRRVPGRLFLWPALAFLGVALLSLGWTFNVEEGVRIWVRTAAPVVLFCFAALLVRTTKDLDRLAVIALASAVVPMVVGFAQIPLGGTIIKSGFPAIPSTFGHPNGYAFFLLVILSVAIAVFAEARTPRRRWLVGTLLVLGVVSLLMCYARSAWLAFAVVVLLLGIALYRRLIVVALVAVIVFPLALPSTAATIEQRFADLSPTSTAYGDSSLNWRFELWQRMWPYAEDRFYLGNGIGTYLPLSDREIGVYDYQFQNGIDRGAGSISVPSHNDYLFLAIENGIVGAALYLAMLGGLMLMLWRARRWPAVRPLATVLLAIVAVLVVIGAADNVKDYNALWYLVLGLAGGVAGATARRPRRRKALW